ncbi:Uncharacterised protein [Vibrio alginolyticus]|nr:Uncharacterised protein [Vibrio alginolyticus]
MTEKGERETNGETMMLLHTLGLGNVEVLNSVLNGCQLLEIFNVCFHFFPNLFTHVHKTDSGLL